jgi:gamma-glutamylcyclotransferase (GGCT)/AIG2-like uncharacterized protein YtfP
MPGQGAWELVAASAIGDPEPASAPGTLHDTGRGYPAACFDAGAPTRIQGVVVRLAGSHSHATLRRLDRFEGPEYRRITVATTAGSADAYDWIGPRNALVTIESGVWPKLGATPADQ